MKNEFFIKDILTNLWSVIAGVLIALIIVIPIGLVVGILSFSDASIPQSRIIFLDVILISGIGVGCMVGGYTTAKISTQRDIIHGLVTGLVLTLLYGAVNDFEINWKYPDIGIAYLGFIPVTLIGTALAIKKSKNIT